MTNRRQILKGALAGAALLQGRLSLAAVVQQVSKANFTVPPGACDCHTHIHGDPAKYPWFAGRTYTPERATPEDMLRIHKALGIQRVIVVTPSVYGTDNSAMLSGLQFRGNDARGVAVIDGKTSDAELERLHHAGVRGIRLNLATGGVRDPAVARKYFEDAAARMKGRGWHVQVNTTLNIIAAMKDTLMASPVPIVFDHFGNAEPEKGVSQAGFADMTELVREGKAYVKISVSGGPRDSYAGFAPMAQALIAANVDRIVWGSNWPHPISGTGRPATEVTPLGQVDNGIVLNQLPLWAPDAAVRHKILVDNPARLYEF